MAAQSEFDIIERYFSFSTAEADIPLAIGDDAACIVSEKNPLVVATDSLLEGVHFPVDFPAEHVASRAMGVNLSDFAAMAARPRWMTMALSLPALDDDWLAAFSQQLQRLCRQWGVVLIGGDTTCGPLSITLTVIGHPAEQHCLLRSGVAPSDDLWLSGPLGLAAAALSLLTTAQGEHWPLTETDRAALLSAFNAPQPRLELSYHLAEVATAAIDISDGLLADAGHLAEKSGVALCIDGDRLPIATALRQHPDRQQLRQWILSGGDDYELLFTASPERRDEIAAIAAALQLPCQRIGVAEAGRGVQLLGDNWQRTTTEGYRHF